MEKLAKSEETRARILNGALDLFRQQGFERTTMREIATEAKVALGSAYYYFDSKESLVMAFYERASEDLGGRVETALDGVKGLEDRLRAILDVKFDYFAPNRLFLGALFGHAANPRSPLSPFSEETKQIRERDMGWFASALDGVRLPKDLAPHMPKLLWLYQMGLILFWIYDLSPGQRRTRMLRDRSLSLVASGIKFAAFPLLRPMRKQLVELIAAVEGDEGKV